MAKTKEKKPTLTQSEAKKAYFALVHISDKVDVSFKTAYKIDRMIDTLSPAFEFGKKKEIELLQKHKGEQVEDGLKFETPEKMQSFMKELDELNELDVEIEVEKIKFTEDDFAGTKIKTSMLRDLKPVAEFVMETE